MEHKENEQQTNLDADQLAGQSRHAEEAGFTDGAASFVPAVLARLGLSSTLPSPGESEEQVVEALRSPAWTTRLAAVGQIETVTQRAQLAALLQSLRDEHENVRAAATRALGTLASQEAVGALVEALHDPVWTVRAAAALSLGKQNGRTPLDPLVAALRDEDATVRASAAWALGTLGAQAPLSPLVSALYDSAWSVREAAVLALGELGARIPAALFLTARSDEDEPVRQAAELVLQRLNPEMLANAPIPTLASASASEASANQQVKLNGHSNSSPKIVQPGAIKQPKQLQRQPVPARKRLFRQVAALVAAVLVVIASMFSWLAVSHHHQLAPSGHTSALAASGIWTYRTTGGPVYRVVWSPEGTEIASTNAVGLIQIRNIATGHVTSTFRGNFLKVLSLAWLPDHDLLVAAQAADRSIQVWNVLTARRILTTPPLETEASTATWSPDGSQIAFDNGETTIQVWNIATATKQVTYKGHGGRINALSWSPDGTEIASASDDRTVQVWNAATGNQDWPSFVHTDAVSVVAWSPDSTRCAVATTNGAVEVWDNPSWNKAEITPASVDESNLHPPLVAFIAWSPDGTHMAFTTAGGPIQVWDAGTTRLLNTFSARTGLVNNLAWSPDGSHIASANSDGTVQVWPIPNTTTVNNRLPH